MKTGTKVWLLVAFALVLIGCILFAGVMANLKWDFGKLSTVQYETNRYEISETFDSISFHTDTADIEFLLSDDGKCAVVCYEEENANHSVHVEDGTLTVNWNGERRVSDLVGHIGINAGTPKITVYLPKTGYSTVSIEESTGDVRIPKDFLFESMDISTSTGDVTNKASVLGCVKIKTGTGDIRVEDIAVDMLDLSVSTGKVMAGSIRCQGDVRVTVSTGEAELTDVTCQNMISTGNTGEISLENVIASEEIAIERSTGDVEFAKCDAAEIRITTDTGDIEGTLLTEKIFIAESDTGSVRVPKTTSGGNCEIITDTGDIDMEIHQ